MKKDDDDDRVLKDGERFRVPMYMLDQQQREAAMRSPMTTDQERRIAQIETYNKRVSDAWKNPTTPPPTAKAATNVYASYDANIQERWKGAA